MPRGHHWGFAVQLAFIHKMAECETVQEAYNRFYLNSGAQVSYPTLCGWWTHWLQYGEVPIITAKRHKREYRKFGRKARRKITPEIVACIKKHLTAQPDIYLDELYDALVAEGGQEWAFHPSTIWAVLIEDLGWTLAVSNARAKQRNELQRVEYRLALQQFSDPSVFVFLDETNKGANASRRRRSWGPKGSNHSLDEFFESGSSATVMAAADIDGFVQSMCELVEGKKHETDEDPYRGTITTERFLLYIQQKVCPNLGSYGQPRSVVVMDNASIHQDERIREAIEACGAILINTAAYCPWDNPIEYCFRQYKSCLRREFKRGQRDWNRFCEVHLKALSLGCVTRENMINYYGHIGCIRNLPSPTTQEDEEAFILLAGSCL